MDVKDLMHDLLDCEMDASVEVVIDSDGYEHDFTDISVEDKIIFQSKYARLFIDIGSMILVEKSEYEDLKDQISGLESEVDSLREMLAEK